MRTHGMRTQEMHVRVDVRALSRDDALALVAQHHIGHIGLGIHDLIRVELTPYVYADDWLYMRAVVGEDLEVLTRHPWAAFEVDEVESVYDWRTVEMSGAVEILSSDPHAAHRFDFEQAVRLLRSVVPALLTAEDPLPDHVRLLRMHVDTVRGRESRLAEGQAPHLRS